MKRVTCLETGETFRSLADAARWCKVTKHAISKAVRRGTRCCGYHFNYADEPLPLEHFHGRRNIAVKCVETGELFPSITEASKAKGVQKGQLSAAVSGKCGGFHWEEVG